jgi:hypothetical protein
VSLLLIDGAEHGSIGSKGWSGITGATVSTSNPRTGARSYNMGSSNAIMTWQCQPADEHATFIAGVAVYGDDDSARCIEFRSDSGATTHITVTLDTDRYVRIRRGSHVGTLLATSAEQLPAGAGYHYVEAKVPLDDAAGEVEVRIDGSTTPIVSFTGDTKNAGTKTVLDSLTLFCQTTGGVQMYWDDIYLCNGAGAINNDFLGDCSVATVVPTATTVANWVGSDGNSVNNEALIDELAFSTTDYVASAVAGAVDHYTMGDVPAGVDIKGVCATIQAFKTDAGARSLRARLVSGASNAQKDLVLGTSATFLQIISDTDPDTAAAWTEAGANAAGVEIEVI